MTFLETYNKIKHIYNKTLEKVTFLLYVIKIHSNDSFVYNSASKTFSDRALRTLCESLQEMCPRWYCCVDAIHSTRLSLIITKSYVCPV